MGTGIILHETGHIMDLQAQRMANTVRHKRSGQIVFNHGLFAHVGHDLVLTQQFSNALVELDVVIHIAFSSLHRANQSQLLIVNVFNQMGKVIIAMCRPGTRQVCRIAVIFRSGIQ